MKVDKYDKDIFDWKMERTLMDPAPPEIECDYCKEKSIYVEDHDIAYRHMGMESKMMPLCIDCYIEFIVGPMDDQWDDYHSGLL